MRTAGGQSPVGDGFCDQCDNGCLVPFLVPRDGLAAQFDLDGNLIRIVYGPLYDPIISRGGDGKFPAAINLTDITSKDKKVLDVLCRVVKTGVPEPVIDVVTWGNRGRMLRGRAIKVDDQSAVIVSRKGADVSLDPRLQKKRTIQD